MAITVLIVLDGGFRFESGAIPPNSDVDFTYSALVDALESAGMVVIRAHRQLDSSATTGWTNFRFDALPSGHSLSEFNAIWLIGLQGRNVALKTPLDTTASGTKALAETELRDIARYMDAGGGVFATGDHDSIGADMSGRIPRVRAMRAWYGEGDSYAGIPANLPRNNPRNGMTRRDTTRRNPAGQYGAASNPAGATDQVWFENQSDAVPQPIVPATSPAHPILRRNGNDILGPVGIHHGRPRSDRQLVRATWRRGNSDDPAQCPALGRLLRQAHGSLWRSMDD